MRRAAAWLLLLVALAARAQPQPDAPPAAQEQAEPAPAAPAEPGVGEAPPPTPAAEAPRPAPKPAAPKPAPKPATAPPPAEDPRDADLAALRAQVARLQSELDAERAAALPPPEEAPAAPRPAGGGLAWLALAVVLALAAGFVLGWRVLDRRVRRRYGGLRIY